jgi:amphi-Trp domain-containing protein
LVKITGRLGKSSGSSEGLEDFEQDIYLTNSEAATLLRELAQEIEAGGRASASTWSLGVNPMQPIKVELQYKFRKKELEIQIKLKETP